MAQKRTVLRHYGRAENCGRLHGKDTGYFRENKKDDFIVKGNCLVKMRTVKDLEGTEHCKVTSANDNRFGGSPHIKVGGV